ncbi:hypothetical protein BDP81DRAFT_164214 [Colletotrichum phormii]|uniref:Uncharacterized protein n=1 Tax=Colletotrichum phormii TaxID=359342 RepID=A0AAI9ZZ22_9PEZI|nr:uncharacterized protein BDP81DRAFT_164214 [Colletotrichum phormii]KAK1640491.1 hypothetical protein BDP81DRAFT_164214 [Colletotrichum phormii]
MLTLLLPRSLAGSHSWSKTRQSCIGSAMTGTSYRASLVLAGQVDIANAAKRWDSNGYSHHTDNQPPFPSDHQHLFPTDQPTASPNTSPYTRSPPTRPLSPAIRRLDFLVLLIIHMNSFHPPPVWSPFWSPFLRIAPRFGPPFSMLGVGGKPQPEPCELSPLNSRTEHWPGAESRWLELWP